MNSDQLIALFEDEHHKDRLGPDVSKLGAAIAFIVAALMLYLGWYFYEQAEAFEADAVAARGLITHSKIGNCSWHVDCYTSHSSPAYSLYLTYQFQTPDGQSIQADTSEPISRPSVMDYRVVGYTEQIHYLKNDPQRIVIGDRKMQIRQWRLYSFYHLGWGIVIAIFTYLKGPYSPLRYD